VFDLVLRQPDEYRAQRLDVARQGERHPEFDLIISLL